MKQWNKGDNLEYKDFNDYELVYYIHDGNEDANNILIKKYEPLINKVALKMLPYCKGNGLELEDLVQEGMIGLNHAIERYKEQEDILFFTYAKKCIERKIISVVVWSNRNKNKVLNESVSYDNDENQIIKYLQDKNPSPLEEVVNIEKEEDLLKEFKKNLTDFEKQVFELHISGFKYKEIAELLNKTPKSIDNTIQRIKTKLKKQMNIKDWNNLLFFI